MSRTTNNEVWGPNDQCLEERPKSHTFWKLLGWFLAAMYAHGIVEPTASDVRAYSLRHGGGAYLGTEPDGKWVTADRESAVMVLGPPRSGKTSAVIIPALLAAPGAAISTSTKPDVMAGIEKTDARERSSIYSAAAGVLAAYNADATRATASEANFDPARFATSTDTIYITAPEHKQALCAPLIVGLLEQVRHAVYEAAQSALTGPPMLWALDEIANIAPIHDLPALVSQAGGQRLQMMIGLQDLSQARTRWGQAAANRRRSADHSSPARSSSLLRRSSTVV
jgi:type IV secretory pathway TraG/TraD family ATPase VirD4